jgi:hypothetical protein
MARLHVERMTEMRVCIIAGLALLVVGKAEATVVDAAADAQRNCELMVKGSFHDNAEARSAGECGGMIESAMFFSSSLPPDVRACPPELGSTLESAKVLLRYLEKNPERVDQPGITVVFEAFRDAWPCQGDDAETPGRTASKKRVSRKAKIRQEGANPAPGSLHKK